MSQLFFSNVVEFFKHLIFGVVSGQMKSIETCITFWIRVCLIIFGSFNHKLYNLIPVALQILEPQNGHSSCSSYIMQQVSQLFLGLLLDILPKP